MAMQHLARRTIRERLEHIAMKTRKFVDLRRSAAIDVSEIRSVCLLLGPYRNLTTLTASILALHPNCQVLNHARIRIEGDPRLDFLSTYSYERFRNFMKFAIRISASGRRGAYGGSFLLSHAFQDHEAIAERYRQRYADQRVKPHIVSLIWKESLWLSSHIRTRSNLGEILERNRLLRFMMPVRNPIDCAFSNLRSGLVRFFPDLDRRSAVEKVVAAVLDELAWFMQQKRSHPERFLYLFEHQFGEPMLREMAHYLSLEDEDAWRRDALACFVDRSKAKYAHPPELREFYLRQVEEKFAAYPDFQIGLLRFAE
jgi:hypothetical protein